jgi:hypothetical protein
MKAMLFSKLKAALAVVVVLGFAATLTTVLACRTAAGQGDKPPTAEKAVKTPEKQEPVSGKTETAKGLKLTLSADKAETWMDKGADYGAVPVKLKLTFTNTSDKPIKLDAYALPFRIQFHLIGPGPDSVKKHLVYVDLAFKPPTEKDYPVIQPGKSWSPSWTPTFPGDIPDGWGAIAAYYLRQPGIYKLRMTVYDKYAPHVEGAPGGTKWLESNELELTVRAKEDGKAQPGSAPPSSQGAAERGQPTKKGQELFPKLPPIPTADPANRSEQVFLVPSQLRVCRLGKSVGVEAVPGAMETVKVTVGKDMVTGLRFEVSVYRDGKLVPSLSGSGGLQGVMPKLPGNDASAGSYAPIAATIGEVGSKDFQPGITYKADLRLTLFETDIPAQHHWAPETGRYKALWSKTLTLDVEAPADGLPVGRWSVEFANGVKETCEISKDGMAFVAEPLRKSKGKAEVKDGSVVIVFEDDRVERWTPVGRRMVVEHWHPGAPYPSGTPVLGIAERSP